MNFIKRSKDNYWHVSTTKHGVYLRIGPQGAAQMIPAKYAREIGEALMEAAERGNPGYIPEWARVPDKEERDKVRRLLAERKAKNAGRED